MIAVFRVLHSQDPGEVVSLSSSVSHFVFEYSTLSRFIGFDKHIFERKIVSIFLAISFNTCFGCSYVLGAQKNGLIETVLLSTHKHMFCLRNKKVIVLVRTLNLRPDSFIVKKITKKS